jgi:hypothetical protein
MRPVSRQRIGKDTYNNIVLLGTVFPIRSVQSDYKEDNEGNLVIDSNAR